MPFGLIEAGLFFGLVLILAGYDLFKTRREMRRSLEPRSDEREK